MKNFSKKLVLQMTIPICLLSLGAFSQVNDNIRMPENNELKAACGENTLAVVKRSGIEYHFCKIKDMEGVIAISDAGYEEDSLIDPSLSLVENLERIIPANQDIPEEVLTDLSSGENSGGEIHRINVDEGLEISAPVNPSAGTYCAIPYELSNYNTTRAFAINQPWNYNEGPYNFPGWDFRDLWSNSKDPVTYHQITASAHKVYGEIDTNPPYRGACAVREVVKSCNTGFTVQKVSYREKAGEGGWNTLVNHALSPGQIAVVQFKTTSDYCSIYKDDDDFQFRSDSYLGGSHQYFTHMVKWVNKN